MNLIYNQLFGENVPVNSYRPTEFEISLHS